MLSRRPDLAIGIDLGTTFSCVGVYQNGTVKIISNEDGNRITPSCVSFTNDGVVKGERAKQRLAMVPQNTVYEVKRLMGKRFDDPTVQGDMKTWPFTVVEDQGKPRIRVTQGTKLRLVSPEEISAMVLTHMKEIAANHLRQPVSKAVITVPAYFDDNQRHATETAAKIAGLDVLRIINEPTAASIAYYHDGEFPTGRNVLVFDIGGGTFDVSILKFDSELIEVVATNGDPHLGGADFDDRILKEALDWFNLTKANQAVRNEASSGEVIRLRKECERAKCLLSQRTIVEVHVDDFHEEKDLIFPVHRDTFEKLNQADFDKTIKLVRETLADAKMQPSDINDIVLVGGSSRIPKLQKLLQHVFNNKPLNKSINPDEAVAYGAALQAAVLNEDQGGGIKDFLLLDVTPLSLGVEIKGGIMSTIVKRNTTIPISQKGNYTTVDDDQTGVNIDVYQGERKLVTDNQHIGSFSLEGIPPAPAGVPSLDVSIDINTNGTIFVVAIDKATGNERHLAIRNEKVRNTHEEVTRMIEDSWKYQAKDEAEYDRVRARNDLESFANWMKYITEEFSDTLTLLDEPAKVKETITWIKNNDNASTATFQQKKSDLEEVCADFPSDYKKPGQLPAGRSRPSSRPTPRTSAPTASQFYDLD